LGRFVVLSKWLLQEKKLIPIWVGNDRAVAAYWLELNDHAPETPITDPESGEIVDWAKGENLGLFKLVKVRSTDGACAKTKGE
jgi:hypothetical protein